MCTRWSLISEAWMLNDIARKIGEVLTALILLKLSKLQGLKEYQDEISLRKKISEVKPLLERLLSDIEYIKQGIYSTTPIIEGLQEEYGFTDLSRIENKIREIMDAISRIENGIYKREDFEEVRRLLECIATTAASRTRELITRARRY